MGYEVATEGDKVVVHLDGDIDLEKSPAVRKLLLDNIDGRDVVVSLEKVNYIDSSGVASLVEALQTAKQKNCQLVLASLSLKVERVLQVARLDKVFTIAATVEEALG
jgi:anti-sigma B factor antagonist